jgi:hypothetical protein
MAKHIKRFSARAAFAPLALVAGLGLAGCDSGFKDKLLEAPDPDLISPSSVGSADAADALRNGAIGRFKAMTGGGTANNESSWMLSGLLADEYRSGDTFVERDETDKRTIQLVNGNVNTAYRAIHRARVAAIIAARELRRFRPTATADIAEMYMIKGYAEVQSGEHFCNGQPFSDASGDDVLYGTPVSTQEAFRLAVASLDSGLAVVGAATDARSTTVRNALRTLKGRAQINLGEFAAAGATVADVPTTSTYQTTYSQVTGDNRIWELNISAGRYTVADRDGGNGLPFVTAVDPRVPICRAAAPVAVRRAADPSPGRVVRRRDPAVPAAHLADA